MQFLRTWLQYRHRYTPLGKPSIPTHYTVSVKLTLGGVGVKGIDAKRSSRWVNITSSLKISQNMLSSQRTHYDSCSKDVFEKPSSTVRHLRVLVSQARPTFILTMEIKMTRGAMSVVFQSQRQRSGNGMSFSLSI